MAQSFLLFDFGQNEDAAQQARHKIEGWRQAFRLDKKLLLKFDRIEPEKRGEAEVSKEELVNGPIYMIIRLDFSDHERLSHQKWVDRIPSEDPFKSASPRVIRHTDPEFEPTADRFDGLT
jgi:hypothetical protein